MRKTALKLATMTLLIGTALLMNKATVTPNTPSLRLSNMVALAQSTGEEPDAYDKFNEHSEQCPSSEAERQWCTNNGTSSKCTSISCAR